jgi:hypothetical protein
MQYDEAMKRLSFAVPTEHIAQVAGISEADLHRTYLDPSSDRYRPPPPNWRRVLAQLAWERAALLQELAKELEHEEDLALL